LASEGTVFEHAVASAALTLPSHASIFTGTFPFQHGVLDNMGFSLANEHLTLAEVLSQAGYSTGAFVGSFVLDSRFGLNQGFHTYSDDFVLTGLEMIGPGFIQKPAEEVASLADEWIREQVERDQKFFAWIHFYDPHAPYEPPSPFSQQNWDTPYDGEIVYVDQVLGDLVRSWRELRILDETMVVLTSDHGESLGEHGEQTHGLFIYESTQRVPLIWIDPTDSTAPQRVKQTVRLVDVAPTILDALGLEGSEGMTGTSLLPLLKSSGGSAREAYAETRYPEFRFGWSSLFAIYRFPFKYIQAPRPELYNLHDDPAELNNLLAQGPDTAHSLQTRLQELLGLGVNSLPPITADPETVRALNALGYLSMSSGGTGEELSVGADPKDQTRIYRELTNAYSMIASGQLSQALEVLETLLPENPRASYIHHPMGIIYSRTGEHKKAAEAYEQALEGSPQDSLLLFNLGSTYLRLRRWDDSERSFRRVLLIDPTHFRARNNLASLSLQEGRYLEALENTQRILQSHPRYEPALFNAGLALLALGRTDEAISRLDRVLEINPKNRDAYRYLAEAYSSVGESGKASDYLERMRSIGTP